MKKLILTLGLIAGLNCLYAAPIHEAAKWNDIGYISLYIAEGNDVNIKDEKGLTPIGYAVDYNGGNFTAKYLAKNGGVLTATINSKQYIPVWVWMRNDPEMIQLMIDRKNDINARTGRSISVNNERQAGGQTPIFHLSNIKSAKLLIENGANINIQDEDGGTPLTTSRSLEVARLLLDNGAAYSRQKPEDHFPNGHDRRFYLRPNHNILTDFLTDQVSDLRQKVEQGFSGNTNPTSEWPRKMWEIDLGESISRISNGPKVGEDNALLVGVSHNVRELYYWISSNGEVKAFDEDKLDSTAIDFAHLSNKAAIFRDRISKDTIGYFRVNGKIMRKVFKAPENMTQHFTYLDSKNVTISWEGSVITGWDFTPPTLASTDNEGGNGDNEAPNSRLVVKTAGPDISIATDGKLGGPAELQKSDDLKNWRRLGDVPEDANEVLVTPRDSGNEFFRLKRIDE